MCIYFWLECKYSRCSRNSPSGGKRIKVVNHKFGLGQGFQTRFASGKSQVFQLSEKRISNQYSLTCTKNLSEIIVVSKCTVPDPPNQKTQSTCEYRVDRAHATALQFFRWAKEGIAANPPQTQSLQCVSSFPASSAKIHDRLALHQHHLAPHHHHLAPHQHHLAVLW